MGFLVGAYIQYILIYLSALTLVETVPKTGEMFQNIHCNVGHTIDFFKPYAVVWNALMDEYFNTLETKGDINVKDGRTRFSYVCSNGIF